MTEAEGPGLLDSGVVTRELIGLKKISPESRRHRMGSRGVPARDAWGGRCVFLRRAVLGCLLMVLCPGAGAGAENNAQSFSEYQIKAGFLFNFTRFVEWPDRAFGGADSPFVVCTLGETPMAGLLTEAAAGKVVNGRAIAIRRAKGGEELRACNVLFVGAAEEKRVGRIVDAVKGMDVLTVGETQGFAQAGGVINFVVQDNKVKLELNMDAAARANLKISAKLIAVSHVVSGSQNSGAN
jgi:hypothetical protein